jgi:hypothetical protein
MPFHVVLWSWKVPIVFSIITPARDHNDPKLQALISSIRCQDFPQDKIEHLVITEGDPESARALGYKRAKGEICVALDSDNFLVYGDIFSKVKRLFDQFPDVAGYYSLFYYCSKDDSSLNRYFALMGNNDPIAYYLGKADRKPYFEKDDNVRMDFVQFDKSIPTIGCNGFFVRKNAIMEADLEHGYHIDVCEDIRRKGFKRYIRNHQPYLWHQTSETLFNFLRKRYRYARDLYCDRRDRRWKMVSSREDYWRLAWFIIATVTVVPTLLTSIRGYCKKRDAAWFWHPVVAAGFLITYGILSVRWLLSRSLFRLLGGQNLSEHALNRSGIKRTKTMRS